MDTAVVTLIPALLAPLASVVPGFPAHGPVAVSPTSIAVLARAVPTARVRPAV